MNKFDVLAKHSDLVANVLTKVSPISNSAMSKSPDEGANDPLHINDEGFAVGDS